MVVLTEDMLKAIVYLWTRDKSMAVNTCTEDYITRELRILMGSKVPKFSDTPRADMASRIVAAVT